MYKITQNITGTFGLSFILVCMLLLAGCKGPTGDEGSKGSKGAQGEQGPVGPAGNDGSIMYAGKDAPSNATGDDGDYYLNNNTGELYGPKGSDGWPDSPSIVLMGDQGSKGEQGDQGDTGPQGADGQDGTKIYSGTAAPSINKGVPGDYFLDEVNYDVYGPKTSSSWGSPINIKGADGNANVTRYIFPGHDFSAIQNETLNISGLTEQDVHQSAWLVYLVSDEILPGREDYFSIPGEIGSTDYGLSHYFSGGNVTFQIHAKSMDIRNYNRIEVMRIAASNTIDKTKIKDNNSIIPEDLDVSDYQAVAEYYGF